MVCINFNYMNAISYYINKQIDNKLKQVAHQEANIEST